MAIEFKRHPSRSEPDEKQEREQEARTRQEFGLETLKEEEELIDDTTFLQMHDEPSEDQLEGSDTQPVLDEARAATPTEFMNE